MRNYKFHGGAKSAAPIASLTIKVEPEAGIEAVRTALLDAAKTARRKATTFKRFAAFLVGVNTWNIFSALWITHSVPLAVFMVVISLFSVHLWAKSREEAQCFDWFIQAGHKDLTERGLPSALQNPSLAQLEDFQ